ncbi:MAG: 3'-5' exonuclease [Kiritimatiellae bacterium]|nr:3'-5' exonuclease [Kiritimatiellia bacterium]
MKNKTSARFASIDFETADRGADSACAVAVVTIENGEIVNRFYQLIRPPRQEFEFTYIHGLEWEDVRNQPTFREIWPLLEEHLKDAKFVAAHNAGFDRSVLNACCAQAGVTPPRIRYECTMTLARRVWRIYPTKLSDVCRRLEIPLCHHRADSDAEACARIVLAAMENGVAFR